jgi:hypothetical protein
MGDKERLIGLEEDGAAIVDDKVRLTELEEDGELVVLGIDGEDGFMK